MQANTEKITTITLTSEEVVLLKRFLGVITLATVEELLPSTDSATHRLINRVLYDLYNSLNDE